jgi:dienelactone hydrolase
MYPRELILRRRTINFAVRPITQRESIIVMPGSLARALGCALVAAFACTAPVSHALVAEVEPEPSLAQAIDVATLRQSVLDAVPSVDQFRKRGPFQAIVRRDITVTLRSKEKVRADLYVPAATVERTPLVILVHGYDNTKADHAQQGMHLATWGMHALVVQVRSRGPWVGNGTLLSRLVQHVRLDPGSIDKGIDPARIVLAGHSFGATAVVVALASGARTSGAVLLDPADAIRGLPTYLRKVRAPVAIVGADERLGSTRNRRVFYTSIGKGVSETSIADAQHDDAQFALDTDFNAADQAKLEFVGALTAASFSIGYTGKLDYAWSSFRDAARKGTMYGLNRK